MLYCGRMVEKSCIEINKQMFLCSKQKKFSQNRKKYTKKHNQTKKTPKNILVLVRFEKRVQRKPRVSFGQRKVKWRQYQLCLKAYLKKT